MSSEPQLARYSFPTRTSSGSIGKTGTLILLRWTLFVSLALLLHTEGGPGSLLGPGGAALAFLALTNFTILVGSKKLAQRPGFPLMLATSDTLISAIVIFSAQINPTEILFLFALVILLVALGNDLRKMVAGAIAVAAFYGYVIFSQRLANAEALAVYLDRIIFLYCVALYFGYMVIQAHEERRSVERARGESHELRSILEILETATSSLDLHHVMSTIVSRICDVIKTDRCSVLFLDNDPNKGWVIASSDAPDVDMLQVDLAKYPEVQRAVKHRSTVVIEDVMTHPLMEPVREEILKAQFNSLMVIPLIFQDETLGMLLLRSANKGHAHGPDEVRFCQTVASASVSALKNALLFRQVKSESELHRATVRKLRNILENSMDVILVTDPDGTITDFNQSAETALGYSRDDVLGRNITEILGANLERSEFLARVRKAEKFCEQFADVRRVDGNNLVLDLTVAAVRNDLGEIVGTVCVGKVPNAVSDH